ncbi:hypothetical protein E1B28_001445 [Marasmius oreades]|uniref:Uncharacterized protein n=1 Tax=Marasmius oreades TaxID=181124 RepID=A0A9P7V3K4_9AGAR|nr:uncharacterized protein E1B28_001445 [Marasmius oreades]KAG7099617.1 hypothetical protein E1B28_001445 [Marasmius oreades]
MTNATNAKGLSFVLIEPGSQISEADHYDWYDNEHSPARLTVPGFFNATRFKAIDSQKPSYLTLYDISEPSVANGPDFEALRTRASARDRAMLEKVQYLNRRTYELLQEPWLHQDTTDASLPGQFMLLVSMEVKAELEEEFNRWFSEEHIPDFLIKIPGWLRSRRYKLYDNLEKGAFEDGSGLKVCKYLALHDFSRGGFMEHEMMKASFETPWAKRIYADLLHREVRVLKLHRIYQKPQ